MTDISEEKVNRMAEWMEHTAADIKENSEDGDALQGVDAARIALSAKMLRTLLSYTKDLESQRLSLLRATTETQVGSPNFDGGAAYELYCAEQEAKE